MIDSLGRVNTGGGKKDGSGRTVPMSVNKFRKRWRDYYNSPEGDRALLEAQNAEPSLRAVVLRLVMPAPQEPPSGPPPTPPFVLILGSNGAQAALGYAPHGVVPGMEQFMPDRVQAALPATTKGHSNGKGSGKRKPTDR